MECSDTEPKNTPADRTVRVLLTGVWDLFHFGHAQAMERAKHLFARTVLVVGIHSDETVAKMKGRVVLQYKERKALLRHIKWIDEILDNAPWVPDINYLSQHNIDIVTGDTVLTEKGEDIYQDLKNAGLFINLPRVPGISSTSILTKVVRNYDSYINTSLDMGSSMKELNVSYLKGVELTAKRHLNRVISANWILISRHNIADTNVRVGAFIKAFGEKLLHRWNVLATVKEIFIRDHEVSGYRYPEKAASDVEYPIDTSDDTVSLALETCKKFVVGWQSVTLRDLKVSTVKGGLTNRLYKISISSSLASSLSDALSNYDEYGNKIVVPQRVLLRIYGEGTEQFFNRDNENLIFQTFSDLKLGPKLYGLFETGRLEEFLSLQTLDQPSLIRLSPKIAQKLASIHASDMPGLSRSPSLFDLLWNWLKIAQDISFPGDPKKNAMLNSFSLNDKLPLELQELQEELLKLDSDVVFCHNDLLSGNIMYDEETDNLCFIDYEYGSYNFRGFDIGNHFCERAIAYGLSEFPHFKLNKEDYPSEKEQFAFISNYLDKLSELNRIPTKGKNILQLIKEANAFALAAHFLWAIWSIIQSASSQIEFGYLEFSKVRLDTYYANKYNFLYGSEQPPEKKLKLVHEGNI